MLQYWVPRLLYGGHLRQLSSLLGPLIVALDACESCLQALPSTRPTVNKSSEVIAWGVEWPGFVMLYMSMLFVCGWVSGSVVMWACACVRQETGIRTFHSNLEL